MSQTDEWRKESNLRAMTRDTVEYHTWRRGAIVQGQILECEFFGHFPLTNGLVIHCAFCNSEVQM